MGREIDAISGGKSAPRCMTLGEQCNNGHDAFGNGILLSPGCCKGLSCTTTGDGELFKAYYCTRTSGAHSVMPNYVNDIGTQDYATDVIELSPTSVYIAAFIICVLLLTSRKKRAYARYS